MLLIKAKHLQVRPYCLSLYDYFVGSEFNGLTLILQTTTYELGSVFSSFHPSFLDTSLNKLPPPTSEGISGDVEGSISFETNLFVIASIRSADI